MLLGYQTPWQPETSYPTYLAGRPEIPAGILRVSWLQRHASVRSIGYPAQGRRGPRLPPPPVPARKVQPCRVHRIQRTHGLLSFAWAGYPDLRLPWAYVGRTFNRPTHYWGTPAIPGDPRVPLRTCLGHRFEWQALDTHTHPARKMPFLAQTPCDPLSPSVTIRAPFRGVGQADVTFTAGQRGL